MRKKLQPLALIIVALAAAFANAQAIKIGEEAQGRGERADALARQVARTLVIADKERDERLDQSCELNERDQEQDAKNYIAEIDDWRELNQYVNGLTPAERKERFNVFIIRGVPERRAELNAARIEATVDQAPEYCDEPGVGLPEPDTALPPNPLR